MAKIKSLSDLNDRLGFTVLSAPDRFPTFTGLFGDNQETNLALAFDILNEGMPFVEKKLEDSAEVARVQKMLDDSFEAYKLGDSKRGAHLLQDIQNMLFPNRFQEYAERKGEDFTPG